ncbi:hypothetical protein KEM54_005055 [Ascosphaera aggregata]|nr:hypothetical protein KEM54_005055 [Ascosphaera aggregata]
MSLNKEGAATQSHKLLQDPSHQENPYLQETTAISTYKSAYFSLYVPRRSSDMSALHRFSVNKQQTLNTLHFSKEIALPCPMKGPDVKMVSGPLTAFTVETGAKRVIDFEELFFCESTMKRRKRFMERSNTIAKRGDWVLTFCILVGNRFMMFERRCEEDGAGINFVAQIDVTKYTLEAGNLQRPSRVSTSFKQLLHRPVPDCKEVRGLEEKEVTFSLIPSQTGLFSSVKKAAGSYHFAVQWSDWTLWEMKIREAQCIAQKLKEEGRYIHGDCVVERNSILSTARPCSHASGYDIIMVDAGNP